MNTTSLTPSIPLPYSEFPKANEFISPICEQAKRSTPLTAVPKELLNLELDLVAIVEIALESIPHDLSEEQKATCSHAVIAHALSLAISSLSSCNKELAGVGFLTPLNIGRGSHEQ